MVSIGEFNEMEVLRETSVGFFLGDGEGYEILLPNKYVPEGLDVADRIVVFVYRDGEERPIATTLKPYIELDEFAALTVRDISEHGAFLDWGLEKDLFVPFREQSKKMEVGERHLVFLYLDEESDRLVASSKIDRFVSNEELTVAEDEKIEVVVWSKTDLGYKVIVNGDHEGLLYHNEVFSDLNVGDGMYGYVKKIREDNKLDVTLSEKAHLTIEPNGKLIFDRMQEAGGFLPLHDKSDPELIKKEFKMSKKNFKKAIGSLYRQRLIVMEKDGIRIAPTPPASPVTPSE